MVSPPHMCIGLSRLRAARSTILGPAHKAGIEPRIGLAMHLSDPLACIFATPWTPPREPAARAIGIDAVAHVWQGPVRPWRRTFARRRVAR